MPLHLRPTTESDAFRIGCIGRDAFSDTLSRSLFPPHLRHKSETGDPALDEAQWRAKRTLKRMKEGKKAFVVVDVPEGGSDGNSAGEGEVVGFAEWEPPSATPHDYAADEAIKEPTPGILDEAKLYKLYEIIGRESKKALGPDGHSKMWYLMVIAIDPAQQRRGIGRMLVQHGLDRAAQDGLDVFLIATPAGRGLYKSLGFREVSEPVTLGGITHYCMLWKKPDAAGSS